MKGFLKAISAFAAFSVVLTAAPAAPADEARRSGDAGSFDDDSPARLKESLDRASGALIDDTRATLASAEDKKRALESAKMNVRASIEKGDALFAEGRIDEAAAEWRRAAAAVKDGGALQTLISSVERESRQLEEARRIAGSVGEFTLGETAVAEFKKSLERDADALRRQASEARSLAEERMKKIEADRRLAEGAIGRGDAAYEAGHYSEAASQWRLALPYAKADDVAPLLDRIEAASRELAEAQDQAQAVPEKPAAPDYFVNGLKEKAERLSAHVSDLRAQALAAQAVLSDRRSKAMELVASAEADYKSGKTAEAVRAWRAALPYFREAEALAPFVDGIESGLSDEAQARAAAEDAARQTKPSAPASLGPELKERADRLSAQAASLKARTAEEEKTAREQAAFAAAAIERGRALLAQDQIADALKAFEEAAPYLRDEVVLRGLVVGLRQADEDLQAAKRMAAPDVDQKPPAPGDTLSLLENYTQRFKAETGRLDASRADAESANEARRAFVQAHLDAGRKAAEAGHWNEALSEWQLLVGYFRDGANLQKAIDGMRAALRDYEAAQSQPSVQQASFAVPPDFIPYLTEKTRLFKLDAANARKKEEDDARRLADLKTSIAEGRRLADSGDVESAIALWKSAAKLVPDRPDLQAKLKDLENAYRERSGAGQAAPPARRKEHYDREITRMFVEVDEIMKRNDIQRDTGK